MLIRQWLNYQYIAFNENMNKNHWDKETTSNNNTVKLPLVKILHLILIDFNHRQPKIQWMDDCFEIGF